MDHLQPHDADQDQRQEKEPPDGHRIVKKEDADQHRADAADPRPDQIGRTHRDVALRQVEQPAAQGHRDDGERQIEQVKARGLARQFEAQRPPHLEESRQQQIKPGHLFVRKYPSHAGFLVAAIPTTARIRHRVQR